MKVTDDERLAVINADSGFGQKIQIHYYYEMCILLYPI